MPVCMVAAVHKDRSSIFYVTRARLQGAHKGWLKFTQAKNARRKSISLEIPILPEPQQIIDATTPLRKDTYLVTEFEKPFSADEFGNRFRKWCDEVGLSYCSAHGLRKAGSARLAELRASDREIMSITGLPKPGGALIVR